MNLLKKYRVVLLVSLVVLLLLLKYFWSLWVFPGVPFGYDAGIYRFLFLVHARGWPPFVLAHLPEWSKAHPLGLFFFSSLFIKGGIPVDWLIGWVWNLFSVLLALVLARVASRTYGRWVGFGVLVAALLSVAQYAGFLQMYWKVLVALLWCTLAFDAFERRSPLVILFGMLAVATHQQIGLLYGLAVVSSLIVSVIVPSAADHRSLLSRTWPFVLSCVLGLLWYIPNWQRSVGDILPLLQRGSTLALAIGMLVAVALILLIVRRHPSPRRPAQIGFVIGCLLLALPLASFAPGPLSRLVAGTASTTPGVFLSVSEYLAASLPLLVIGIVGWILLLRQRPASPWLWASAWSALAVASTFFFYYRFLLPLDFFLLLPAGYVLVRVIGQRRLIPTALVACLVVAQGALLVPRIASADPHVSAAFLQSLRALPASVAPGNKVVVLDNMAPWVVGFLPDASVSGPGIFDSLPQSDWQKFLLGSAGDRQAFFAHYKAGTYFLATEVFHRYYPVQVTSLLEHPCLHPLSVPGLYRLDCPSR